MERCVCEPCSPLCDQRWWCCLSCGLELVTHSDKLRYQCDRLKLRQVDELFTKADNGGKMFADLSPETWSWWNKVAYILFFVCNFKCLHPSPAVNVSAVLILSLCRSEGAVSHLPSLSPISQRCSPWLCEAWTGPEWETWATQRNPSLSFAWRLAVAMTTEDFRWAEMRRVMWCFSGVCLCFCDRVGEN